jgi:hypothetical protein
VAAVTAAPLDTSKLLAGMQEVLAGYRKIIVLFADEKPWARTSAPWPTRWARACSMKTARVWPRSSRRWRRWRLRATRSVLTRWAGLLDYIESDKGLFDADRLAFRELLRSLQAAVAADSSLPAIKLHKRIGEDLDALLEIERNYEKEIRLVFGRFEPRAIELKRERWEDYVAYLKKLYTRAQILKDYGVVLPYPGSPRRPGTQGQGRGRRARSSATACRPRPSC